MNKKLTGKGARAKGLNFERQIAVALRGVFPNARRHLENHKDDAQGYDIDNTDNYRIQIKRLRKYVSLNTLKEVQCDEMIGEVPILISKADNERILVVMPFEEWLRLLKK